MAIPFIGEIRTFAGNFAPYGWFYCQGQRLSITEFQALYAVIGATYGGDGSTYFNLPNLQAYAPMGQGAGTGLTPRTLGHACGVPATTLIDNQMPPHTHAAQGTNATGTSNNPANRIWAKVISTPQIQPYGKTVASTPVAMKADALASAGGGSTHSNMQPYQGINFIMAWQGDFPVRQ
ncbi:phage tail protein [Geotalea uraniireducens]|uniref:Phage Tail Collar domain protein n=1 Tax=Geotalea uraniireducens (strain Rf4) TaxID=351605 RepID=A5GA43_GEOUR|nr:tail fiber protein [Geotalea uraniireducens]ABQ25551.1 phage Tail Collar domain protein [Geotalea uraniireducens Rf4]